VRVKKEERERGCCEDDKSETDEEMGISWSTDLGGLGSDGGGGDSRLTAL